jgi:hypothetical protein
MAYYALMPALALRPTGKWPNEPIIHFSTYNPEDGTKSTYWRPKSLLRLSRLASEGRISSDEYATLMKEILEDFDKAPPNYLKILVPGRNVTITRTTDARELRAVSRVFNTPELLEAILVKLVPKYPGYSHYYATDLVLRASLTCRGFKDAIDNSPEIGRELFKKADTHYSLPLRHFPFAIHHRRIFEPISHVECEAISNFESCGGSMLALNFHIGDISIRTLSTAGSCYITQPPVRHAVLLRRSRLCY